MNNPNLRVYTSKHLSPGKYNNFLKKHSVTVWLIIINIAFFISSFFLFGIFGEEAISWVALQSNAFFSGQVWQLLTSMFMHGGFGHLFVNMISLFFIGSFIEKLIGRKRFFWFYMLSGIFAGLMFVSLSYFFGISELGAKIFGSPEVFAVGASGAIFALGGLLAILTPNLRVYVFFIIPMRMWTAMIALLGVLWLASISAGLPFGNTAHFGGLIIGILYGVYLKKKYPKKTKWLSKHFAG